MQAKNLKTEKLNTMKKQLFFIQIFAIIGLSTFMPIGTVNAQTAYITGSNYIFVINIATNTVVDTISGFSSPHGVSVSSDGSKVYVTNFG